MRGMRLGPILPAFITPEIIDVLSDAFDLKPIGAPAEDLAETLNP